MSKQLKTQQVAVLPVDRESFYPDLASAVAAIGEEFEYQVCEERPLEIPDSFEVCGLLHDFIHDRSGLFDSDIADDLVRSVKSEVVALAAALGRSGVLAHYPVGDVLTWKPEPDPEPVAEIGPGTWVRYEGSNTRPLVYVIRPALGGRGWLFAWSDEAADEVTEQIWHLRHHEASDVAPDPAVAAGVYRALDGKECDRCGGNGLECVPCGGVGVFPPVEVG